MSGRMQVAQNFLRSSRTTACAVAHFIAAVMAGFAAGFMATLNLALLSATPVVAQEPFRIGLVALPGKDAGVEGLSDIKSTYAAALGRPVEVLVARDYGLLATAQMEGRIDYAVYSAVAYAAAMRRCNCLVPLAAPVDEKGIVGFQSLLIVRSDGPGERGRLAIGPVDSLATRLAPLAGSSAAQTAAAEARLVETDSAGQAQAMFLAGAIDGFFGWLPTRNRTEDAHDSTPATGTLMQLEAAGLDPSTWRIAWRSPLLRYGPHAIRNDLPEADARRLSTLLTGVTGDEVEFSTRLTSGHGNRFLPVTAEDYAAVVAALAAIAEQ